LRNVQRAASPAQAQQIIADALPPVVAEALQATDLDRVHQHLKQLPEPAERPRLSGENWRGAVGVFLLVFLSTLPVIVPFVVMQDARLALRISNGIAIAMLFGAGSMLAGHAGMRPVPTGLAMVAIGSALVALTIALGG
jgi:VIT1/CCC1 family predicted Fe2+/Mn2+ transporter